MMVLKRSLIRWKPADSSCAVCTRLYEVAGRTGIGPMNQPAGPISFRPLMLATRGAGLFVDLVVLPAESPGYGLTVFQWWMRRAL